MRRAIVNPYPVDQIYTVRSDIVEIAAPAAVVWDILTNFPAYGEWNAMTPAITGEAAQDAKIIMKTWHELLNQYLTLHYDIMEFVPGKTIAWAGYLPEYELIARRDLIIEPLGEDRCAYYTVDIFAGPGGREQAEINTRWVSAAFNRQAQSLRDRAETMAMAA